MDITPQIKTQQPISDDQDLAKALAGVLPDEPATQPAASDQTLPELPNMQFEPTTASIDDLPAEPPASDVSPQDEPSEDISPVLPPFEMPMPQETAAPETAPAPAPTEPTGELADIKKDALNELRPLIDKVTLPPEEKFNTYLMLIRSTDDVTLIGPAHEAAQAIPDEAIRAQALLDIIKEIDYLSQTTSQQSA